MSPEQEAHLQSIKSDFDLLVDGKYRKGAAEHGGDLISMKELQLIDMAIEEVIDQFVYLTTLRRKICP